MSLVYTNGHVQNAPVAFQLAPQQNYTVKGGNVAAVVGKNLACVLMCVLLLVDNHKPQA